MMTGVCDAQSPLGQQHSKPQAGGKGTDLALPSEDTLSANLARRCGRRGRLNFCFQPPVRRR